ncbi:SusC/RagA family TonB-linked outer membrane protein [Wenyingzhuangia sp. IMCC45574]
MKKLRFCYYLIFIMLFPLFAFAQSREVTGKVMDHEGIPLPGTYVTISGTTKGGQITDFDGVFKIKVPEGAKTLEVSYLGYKKRFINLTDKKEYFVKLELQENSLEEVVVVGYGTQKRSDITGSVATVKVNEAVAAQNSTVDQLLQGKAAGVQVSQSGQPGSGVSVRIRGANSLRSNNEPLYVIDGVIISSAGEDAVYANNGGNNVQEPQNGLNGINPRDIESIEILKDASATAIYGSRGANGVVLITTKSGSKGKTRISAYATTSMSKINKRIDVLNGVDFAKYQNEVAEVDGAAPKYRIEDDGSIYDLAPQADPNLALRVVNWHDEIFNTAYSYTGGFSFSGGSDKGNYAVTGGYNENQGIIENANFKSGNFNVKLSQNLNDNLKVNANVRLFYGKGSFAQDGDRAGGDRSFISNVNRFSPIINPDADVDTDIGLANPYSWINDFQDVSEEKRIVGNMSLIYKFGIKGLSYKLQAGGNIRDKSRDRFYGLTTFQGSSVNGYLRSSLLSVKSYQINNLLTYNRTFKKKHRVNAVVGATYDVRDRLVTNAEYTNFSTFVFGYKNPVYGTVSDPLERLNIKEELRSFLTRATYAYKDKYIFTGTFRSDASSKFKGDNKVGYFPSVALAWNVTKEDFLKKSPILNNLKLRTGWGQVGNQGVQPYETTSNYGPAFYGDGIGFVATNLQNEGLKWETTISTNAGVDFGMFKNRLTGSIDAYVKDTDDLLQTTRIATSNGFETTETNGGAIQNKGLEFALSGIVYDNKKDFKVSVSGNIAFNKTKITKLGNDNINNIYITPENLESREFYLGDNVSSGAIFGAPANIFIKGEEIGLFYGFKTDGIWQEGDADITNGYVPGDVKILDLNGDGEITAADRTIIGNPNPDFVYGASVNVSYKRFSLQMLMNGVYGNDIANGSFIRLGNPTGDNSNITQSAYNNAWRADNPSTTNPRIGYNKVDRAQAVEDRAIEDGSFLRINNITLGYDIPVEKTNLFSRANVYVSGLNLFTFTNYSGYNPEVTSFLSNGNILGVDWNGLPNVSSVLLGLNLNF